MRKVHPKMTPDQVPALLDTLIEAARGDGTPVSPIRAGG